jgi:hypothetical protein
VEPCEVLFDALAQSKKRQDGDDDDDYADDVDDFVHELSFYVGKESNRGVRPGMTMPGQVPTAGYASERARSVRRRTECKRAETGIKSMAA